MVVIVVAYLHTMVSLLHSGVNLSSLNYSNDTENTFVLNYTL